MIPSAISASHWPGWNENVERASRSRFEGGVARKPALKAVVPAADEIVTRLADDGQLQAESRCDSLDCR